jgi:hypothetical protein
MTTRDEAIKAATEAGIRAKTFFESEGLDRFYALAFNAGMERAAEICKETSDAGAVQNCIDEIRNEAKK